MKADSSWRICLAIALLSTALVPQVRAQEEEAETRPVMQRELKSVEGPWDAATDSPIQFNTVRNDVQIALRYGAMPIEQRRELLERAYARMGMDAGATP